MKPNTVKSKQATSPHSSPFPSFRFRPLSSFVLLSGVRQCQLSPGSVSKRAEPFHKLVNSGGEQKVTQQCRPPATQPTQTLPTLNTFANLSPMSVKPEGRTEQETVPLLMLRYSKMYFSHLERELVFLGQCPPCVSRQNILCCLGYCSPAALCLL